MIQRGEMKSISEGRCARRHAVGSEGRGGISATSTLPTCPFLALRCRAFQKLNLRSRAQRIYINRSKELHTIRTPNIENESKVIIKVTGLYKIPVTGNLLNWDELRPEGLLVMILLVLSDE
jgi:hypothetical protein